VPAVVINRRHLIQGGQPPEVFEQALAPDRGGQRPERGGAQHRDQGPHRQRRSLLPRARALAGGDAELIEQDDSFFAVPHGRLKLRRFADGSAELIHYHRPDRAEPKASRLRARAGARPDALAWRWHAPTACWAACASGAGCCWWGQTRIHLDRVDGLGDFMELEVVLRDGQSDAEGQAIADALMQALGLDDAPRIAGAYRDLLAQQQADTA
jgi:adenylate cyclase class IV